MNVRATGILAGTAWLACAAALAADATFTNTVSVVFAETSATVSNGAGSGVTWSQLGADLAFTSTVEGVEYVVSGSSSAGSLKISGVPACKVVLAGVDLAASCQPALNVSTTNGCSLVLADGTTNALTDGPAYVEAIEGALYSSGPLAIGGNGGLVLAVRGPEHGIYSPTNVWIQGGDVSVSGPPKDALHVGGTFTMDNGSLALSAESDAIDADRVFINGGSIEILSVPENVEGIKCDGDMVVGGGAINVVVRGDRSKGIGCGGSLEIDRGALSFLLSGDVYLKTVTNSAPNYVDPKYCTGISCASNLTIQGGSIVMTHTGLAGKGISVDGNLTMNDGKIDVVSSGGASSTFTNAALARDLAAPDCIRVDGAVSIFGGTVNMRATGNAGDCLSAGGALTIGVAGITNRPDVRGETTGQKVLVSGSDYANPKAVTCDGRVTINGGTTALATANDGGEGLESKTNITINGGMLTVAAYDDCIQADSAASNALITINGGTINVAASGNGEGIESKGNVLINGGHVEITAGDDCINATRGNTSGTVIVNGGLLYCYSSNNDGVDANGDMTINGGFLIASGTESPEESFDSNTHLYVNGGTLVGTAGSSFMCPVGSQSNRCSILYNGSATAGTIVQIRLNGSDALVYKIPRTYSGGGGGPPGGSSKYLYLFYSSTNVVSGASGTIVTGATVSAGTEFHGYYAGATVSGGTTAKTFTVTNILTTVK